MSELSNKIDQVRDILRTDDGISGAMDYTQAISWVLFLKFLDDYESSLNDEAFLENRTYSYVIDKEHRWSTWACPKDENGKLDIRNAVTSDDLTDYVNQNLFPYLKSFNDDVQDVKSVRYMVGNIFGYIRNNIANGSTLREVLNVIDTLNFQSNDEMFELSLIYETLLKNMGGSSDAGEFYTPRSVIKTMVESVNPTVGETVYDGAVGSGGFLIQAYDHMSKANLSTQEQEFLKRDTFFGNEKTPLGYVMGVMNMILHGIDSPNVYKQNTLTENIRDIQEKERHNVILANPPFGGKEKSQVQQNFPVQSGATEILFMQHFMKMLKLDGKAAIVVPEGVLFQGNNAFKQVKQELLENFNVHTILSLPAGVFLPYSGVKTNIIYFDRKGATSEIWYYELEPPYKLTKNKPIQYEHFKEFLELYESKKESDNSWLVKVEDIKDYDISAKNPNAAQEEELLPPKEILQTIRTNEKELGELINHIESLLNDSVVENTLSEGWKNFPLGNLAKFSQGQQIGLKSHFTENKEGLNRFIRIVDYTQQTEDKRFVDYFNEKHYVNKDDIVMVRYGAIGFVGRGIEGIIANNLFKISPDEKLISKECLFIYLKYGETVKNLSRIMGASTMPAINFKAVSSLEIPLPPLEEQKRIVAKINGLFAKIDKAITLTSGSVSLNAQSNLEGQAKYLYQLKPSILSKAFKGEL